MKYLVYLLCLTALSPIAFAKECSFNDRETIYDEITNPSNEYSQDAETKANGVIVAAALIEESFGAKCEVLESNNDFAVTITKYLVTTTNQAFEIVYSYDNEAGYPNSFTISLVK